MGEAVFFRNLTTKGLTAVNSGERYFEGYLTVQVKDKQGEVTIVDELMKVLPVWIDRGAPISDTHSNRIIGKGINYSKVDYKDKDGEIYPAIKVTGKIHKNYELDNDIWQKIKSGEYKGLSFGGATKSDREPMRMKDGSIAYSLKDLEHYEVAVCRDPAVPLALITEYNTLAKAAVDGQDLGGGRMMIKCDKFGCYVDKENREAGLKAPEARNEALVYDDKTHDQPSETPEENQKKIKKGEADAATDKLIQEVKDPDQRKDLMERQSKQQTHAQDVAHNISERQHKREVGKGATIIADPKGKPFCARCGRSHRVEDAKNIAADKEDPTLMVSGTGGGKSPNCPNCGYRPEKKKGEDWSNADGDMQTSMNTQNVDEGGMGKHKQKRDSVLQGYGGEQNNTGEVGWSGSGSPYPKKKGEDKEQEDFNKINPNFSKKKRKKKAIITNIHTRLKNLDFMLKKEKKIDLSIGGFDRDEEAYKKEAPARAKRARERRIARQDKEMKKNPPDISRELRALKRIQRATVTNIHTRLKNLDFMLRAAPGDIKAPKPKESHGIDERGNPRRLGRDADLIAIPQNRSGQAEREHGSGMIRDEGLESDSDTSSRSPTKKAVITNIHSRLKSLDFLLRGQCHLEHEGTCAEAIAEESSEDTKRKWRKRNRKKDGEFGGMNTGEVEWTEPRDTANSRTKRDKDVA